MPSSPTPVYPRMAELFQTSEYHPEISTDASVPQILFVRVAADSEVTPTNPTICERGSGVPVNIPG